MLPGKNLRWFNYTCKKGKQRGISADKLTNGHRGSIGESKTTVGDASIAVEMNKHFISSRFHYPSCVITTESA